MNDEDDCVSKGEFNHNNCDIDVDALLEYQSIENERRRRLLYCEININIIKSSISQAISLFAICPNYMAEFQATFNMRRVENDSSLWSFLNML